MIADGDRSPQPPRARGPILAGEDNIFKRGLAVAIDFFLLYGFILSVFLPATAMAGVPSGTLTEIISNLAVHGLYFIGLWTWTGQTVGKKLFGLRVVRADGHPLSLGRATLRYATYVAMVLPVFLGFLFSSLFLIFSSRQQGFHDRLVGSLVVRLR